MLLKPPQLLLEFLLVISTELDSCENKSWIVKILHRGSYIVLERVIFLVLFLALFFPEHEV